MANTSSKQQRLTSCIKKMKGIMVDEPSLRIRVERSGPILPLTPRISTFLREKLGGVSLDEDGDVEKRPDFVCLKGLVAIEIKSLEVSPSERLATALAPEMSSVDWPAFYGSWPVASILKHLPNAKEVQERLLNRLGRTVVRVVKKANDQLAQHTARAQRRNLVRLLFLLNEGHPEYDPSAIGFVVHRELARKNSSDGYRNNDIDAVIYLSDRHVAAVGGNIYLPAVIIPGPNLDEQPWKIDVINLILSRWAAWNEVKILPDGVVGLESVSIAEYLPEAMKRHELWALEYRRRPYMRNWTESDLRNLWDHVMLLSLLWGHTNTPMKVPQDGYMQVMMRFTHLMQEVSVRGLPLDFFRQNSVRLGRAVDSLPYGPHVATWLRQTLNLQMGDS